MMIQTLVQILLLNLFRFFKNLMDRLQDVICGSNFQLNLKSDGEKDKKKQNLWFKKKNESQEIITQTGDLKISDIHDSLGGFYCFMCHFFEKLAKKWKIQDLKSHVPFTSHYMIRRLLNVKNWQKTSMQEKLVGVTLQ